RVALPRLHEGEVRLERLLEDVPAPVDLAGLLPLGDHGPVARRREEAADPGPAGADPLGERALRDELDLELARERELLEVLVLAHVARDHLPDLARLEEDPDPEVVDAGVVR